MNRITVTFDRGGSTMRQVEIFDMVDKWISSDGVTLSTMWHGDRIVVHDVVRKGGLGAHMERDTTKRHKDGEPLDVTHAQECVILVNGDLVFQMTSTLDVKDDKGHVVFRVLTDVPGTWEALLRRLTATS